MNKQGGDSPAGMQALPVGKIIEAKVLRKDSQEIVQTCIMCEGNQEKLEKINQIKEIYLESPEIS